VATSGREDGDELDGSHPPNRERSSVSAAQSCSLLRFNAAVLRTIGGICFGHELYNIHSG